MDAKEQRTALRAAVYRRDGPAVVHLLRSVSGDDVSDIAATRALQLARRGGGPVEIA